MCSTVERLRSILFGHEKEKISLYQENQTHEETRSLVHAAGNVQL